MLSIFINLFMCVQMHIYTSLVNILWQLRSILRTYKVEGENWLQLVCTLTHTGTFNPSLHTNHPHELKGNWVVSEVKEDSGPETSSQCFWHFLGMFSLNPFGILDTESMHFLVMGVVWGVQRQSTMQHKMLPNNYLYQIHDHSPASVSQALGFHLCNTSIHFEDDYSV